MPLHPSVQNCMYLQYSTKVFGALSPPPLVFLRVLLNKCTYQRQNFSVLSRINFTHYVKFWKSRMAINGVRVTSCSVDFDTATDSVFKLRSIGLYDMIQYGYKTAISDFWNFENFKIQNFLFPFFKNFSLKLKFSQKPEHTSMLSDNG